MSETGNRGKWVASIVLTLVVILIMLLLAEGAVRVRQHLRYGDMPTVEKTFEVDRETGLRVPVARLDGGPIQINSLGFRGDEIPREKPADTVRIAFMGASTTYCAEVSGNDRTWPHRATEMLRERFPDTRFDYVNAGVPGYVVASSVQNLEDRVAPLNPDVIVIYHATNDLAWETRSLAAEQGLYEIPEPAQESWLARHSLLWELVEKNVSILAAQRSADDADAKLDLAPGQIGAGFTRGLTQLSTLAGDTGARVAIARFSHQLREEQSPERRLQAAASALYYMPFLTPEGLLTGYRRFNQVIDTVGADTNALVIGGEYDIPGDPAHFTDSVHFNDAGAERMAQRVADALASDAAFLEIVSRRGEGE